MLERGVIEMSTANRREWFEKALSERALGLIALVVVFFAVIVWPFPAPLGVVLGGMLVGGRIALIALGFALVYRASRVVNFAQGDLGQVPATLVVLLVISAGWSYWLALVIGIAASLTLGGLVEVLIIRRFFRAPRLILTVATIGLAQILTGLALFIPGLFNTSALASRIEPPFKVHIDFGGVIFNANDLLTMIIVPVAFISLALFLQKSSAGIAIRGAAERADRASMLGIPVKRLSTIVWALASLLAFLAMFLRAGAVGLPIGSVLGPTFFLQALAAAVIGRFERFPTIALAAIALGVVDQAMTFQAGNRPAYNDLMLFGVVLLGLLLTGRASKGRSGSEASTWQAAREVRPIPRELLNLPEIRIGRWVLGLGLIAFVLSLPAWLSVSRLDISTVIVIWSIVALSLVVLTGWAGQVSLGQMALAGIGAAVGGALTAVHGLDLFLALLGGGVAGAIIAVIIGYPAIRRGGLTLAVSTLAFALVTWSFVLNQEFLGDWLPSGRIETPQFLWGAIDISSDTRLFYLCVGVLALALIAVRGLRASRTGRVLIAIRENDRAVRSYGVSAMRTTLSGFAVSGFLAAVAGVLLVHQQHGLDVTNFAPSESIQAFSMVVIGGLGSISGAVLGAIYVRGAAWLLPAEWQFLATGAGLLLVLLLLPGGLGAALADMRDGILRSIARRRNIIVPSLLADRRVEELAPIKIDASALEGIGDSA
ncbi:MAG: hypothetical protein RLY23_711 [Actinomycetota bacterium]